LVVADGGRTPDLGEIGIIEALLKKKLAPGTAKLLDCGGAGLMGTDVQVECHK
jgi:hypothetical protein